MKTIKIAGYKITIETRANTLGVKVYKGKHLNNIHELYGKDANWIIAECLFEMDM